MARVLVTYFSVTGNTKAMAEAVAKGVRSVAGVDCDYRPVEDVTNNDLVAADGIMLALRPTSGRWLPR